MDVRAKRAEPIRLQPWLSMPPGVSQTLRNAMTQYCGVRRKASGLNHLIDLIDQLIHQVGRANPLIASRVIACAALAREESRGGHFRTDFPETKTDARSSYITYDRLN